MTVETWLAFVATTVVLLVIPGPTVLTVVSYSVAQGRRAVLPLVAGVALGDATSLAVSILGLGAVLAASSLLFTVVKGAGSLYLIWLGIKLLMAGVRPEAPRLSSATGSLRRMFANTYLVTALNPKGIVFFVAFLPQFINPGEAAGRQLWILAGTFVGLAIVNASCYSLFAAGTSRLLGSSRSQRFGNLAGGSLLTAAGLWAFFAKRHA